MDGLAAIRWVIIWEELLKANVKISTSVGVGGGVGMGERGLCVHKPGLP